MSQNEWFDKDYYKDLGVSKTASEADIKKAYRKLARDNHPDSHPGDAAAEERFKKISEAYSVVGDPTKRKEYDDFKAMAGSGMGFGGGRGFGGFTPGNSGASFSVNDLFGEGGLGDLLGHFAGTGATSRGFGQTRSARPQRGADVETEITLDFREATRGATVPLRVTNPSACQTCNGSGSKSGGSTQCSRCHGKGVISENKGAFGFSKPCPDCDGTGVSITDPCPDCNGTGVTTRTRTITVRIPAGLVDGQVVRLAGQGEAGKRGRPAGDLLVTVHVTPDPLFTRSGDDLHLTVPVSFTELALGGTITVPTLDNKVRVKIPAGTDDGRTLRVRGRGVPRRGHDAGDLLVTVKVAVPSTLDDAAANILRQYAAEEKRVGFDPRAQWPGAQ